MKTVVPRSLSRLKQDPLGSIKRIFHHIFIGRLKYSRRADFDARRYWNDRFKKHGLSFVAVGDQGLSEADNKARHEAARNRFLNFCGEQNIDFRSAQTLEVGCGTGFYTEALREGGVSRSVCIDITDALFPQLREMYPDYEFLKLDVSAEQIHGSYDLIIMIDVIQHIISPKRLKFVMENVRDSLSENGVFIVAPICGSSKRIPFLYFVRTWSQEDVLRHFDGLVKSEPAFFREGDSILAIRKQPGQSL